MHALEYVRDAEVLGASQDDRRLARGDDGRGDAAELLQHLDAMAVERVEAFDRFAIGAVIQAAVGGHGVVIEKHQPDLLGFGNDGGADRAESICHQITLARVRSWICRAPTSLPAASATSTWLMRNSSISCTASTANWSGLMVRGPRCMTSAIANLVKSSPRSSRRRRSPSVNTPIGWYCASTTAVIAMPLRVISISAADSETSGVTAGMASPLRITSRTCVSRRRPSAPPGWERAKSSSMKPRASSNETASASPMAKVAVVLAVGARFSVQASWSTPTFRWTADRRARLESSLPVMAIR